MKCKRCFEQAVNDSRISSLLAKIEANGGYCLSECLRTFFVAALAECGSDLILLRLSYGGQAEVGYSKNLSSETASLS
jgi:hypothetical protein